MGVNSSSLNIEGILGYTIFEGEIYEYIPHKNSWENKINLPLNPMTYLIANYDR